MKNYWLPKDERGIKAQTKALRELREELECALSDDPELDVEDALDHGAIVCERCRSFGGSRH